VHETLAAHEQLFEEEIPIRVIDLYSIKPIDEETLREAAEATQCLLTVEDHYAEGGLGEAVKSALADSAVPVYSLAVGRKPMSGKPDELRDYEGISSEAIVRAIHGVIEKKELTSRSVPV
ncbi:MAG: transketolase, partial [Candidatus Omnitrophica bacterium]|nr:transketolase [Candidatus Omnitrophota bacterium]